LLDQLQKSHKVDVRGIWPILSLGFRNRSGLALFTLFNNSQVKHEEILWKNKFMKDLRTL